jgi:hypothetical protein
VLVVAEPVLVLALDVPSALRVAGAVAVSVAVSAAGEVAAPVAVAGLEVVAVADTGFFGDVDDGEGTVPDVFVPGALPTA